MKNSPLGGAYGRFWNPENRIPCSAPPFGELVAVNANTGDMAWRVPLGIVEELEAKGIRNTGALNLGGSMATASGLVFIGATADSRFRAFDAKTGKELWVDEDRCRREGGADDVPRARRTAVRRHHGRRRIAVEQDDPGVGPEPHRVRAARGGQPAMSRN